MLGDAEAVEDAGVLALRRVEPRGAAQLFGVDADDVGLGFRRMPRLGDETRPRFEIVRVATSFTKSSFTRPSVTMTWLIALMKATLVPGFSGRW